jgi:flavin reductase (DIM6/NTAB) family NADH-FMN oxidoreductase RutF
VSGGTEVVGPVPEGRDPDAYDRLRRRVLWSLPTGLYLLGTRAGERRNLMTVSLVTQVAVRPKVVAVSVDTTAVTHGLLAESGAFALSVLPRAERAVVRRFVKPVDDVALDDGRALSMNGEAVVEAPSGLPVLAAAAAWLDCAVVGHHGFDSHTVFFGEVLDCATGAPGAPGGDDVGEVLRMEDTRMNYGG